MIRFSYSNEDTKDEERRKGLGGRKTTKCGAKRQARTLSQDQTPQQLLWQRYKIAETSCMYFVRRQVFINRKPGLPLGSVLVEMERRC
jgi:hypothetical protein